MSDEPMVRTIEFDVPRATNIIAGEDVVARKYTMHTVVAGHSYMLVGYVVRCRIITNGLKQEWWVGDNRPHYPDEVLDRPNTGIAAGKDHDKVRAHLLDWMAGAIKDQILQGVNR